NYKAHLARHDNEEYDLAVKVKKTSNESSFENLSEKSRGFDDDSNTGSDVNLSLLQNFKENSNTGSDENLSIPTNFEEDCYRGSDENLPLPQKSIEKIFITEDDHCIVKQEPDDSDDNLRDLSNDETEKITSLSDFVPGKRMKRNSTYDTPKLAVKEEPVDNDEERDPFQIANT
ncbi:hypothetical protein SK128_012134, partial [Halocaridina rubra]